MRSDHTRAMEVSVVILVAAAGISVAIGVGETTSHHSGAVWWAIATACFLGAILIPVFAFVIHPFFAQRRQDMPVETEELALPADEDVPAQLPAAWIEPDDLGQYLEQINRTMEEHGFGRNPNPPDSNNGEGNVEAVDQNPRETYRAALIGKGMDVRRGLFPGAGLTGIAAALIPFDSRVVSSWLSEAQTYLYIEGSAMADAKLVRGYVNAPEAVKAVDATLEALRHLGADQIPF